MRELRMVRNCVFMVMVVVLVGSRGGRLMAEDLGCQFAGYHGPNQYCMTDPADVETGFSNCVVGNTFACNSNFNETCEAFCGTGNVVNGNCDYSFCDEGGGGEVEPFRIMVDWYIWCECGDAIGEGRN